MILTINKEDFPVGFMNFIDFFMGIKLKYPEVDFNLPEVNFVSYSHEFIRSVFGEDTGAGFHKFIKEGV
jgi:hypothetical protein